MGLEKNTLKQTVILGVFFLLLVTTYISFSNIITFIFEHDSVQFPFTGGLALILNYFVYLVGLTYAATLKNYKRQFQIAAVAYTINYVFYIVDFNEVYRLVVTIITSVVSGYGASVLWVSQGGYMVKLFRKYRISPHDEGQYMGIQSAIIYGQVIMGGAVTTFALGIFGNTTYFIVLSAIGILALIFVHFFLDSLQTEEQIEDARAISSGQKKQEKRSFFTQLLKVLKFYPAMKHIIPAMALDGLLLGFTTTNFSSLLRESQNTSFNVGLLHISNGVGAILGGYLSGYLSSKMPVLRQGVVLLFTTILTLLLSYFVKLINFQTIGYPLFVTFLWGISLFFLQGWLFVACVKLFQGRIQSFAVVKQVHTISFILFQAYSLLQDQKVNFYVTISIILGVAFLQWVICMCMQTNRKERQLAEQEIGQMSPID